MHSLEWVLANITRNDDVGRHVRSSPISAGDMEVDGGAGSSSGSESESEDIYCNLNVGDTIAGSYKIDAVIKIDAGESSVYGCGQIAAKVFHDRCDYRYELRVAAELARITAMKAGAAGADITPAAAGWPEGIIRILGFGRHYHVTDVIRIHDVMYMERAQFSLHKVFEFVSVRNQMPRKTLDCICRQVLSALDCMQSHGFVIADLKPENVLVMTDCTPQDLISSDIRPVVKISDFGASDKYPAESSGIIGTWEYTAPEGLQIRDYGPPADIWAFGIMYLVIATGVYLFGIDEDETPKYGAIDSFLADFPRPDQESSNTYADCRQYLAFLMAAVIGPVAIKWKKKSEAKKARRFPAVEPIGLRAFLEMNMVDVENPTGPDASVNIARYLEVLSGCIKIDPAERATAAELAVYFPRD